MTDGSFTLRPSALDSFEHCFELGSSLSVLLAGWASRPDEALSLERVGMYVATYVISLLERERVVESNEHSTTFFHPP